MRSVHGGISLFQEAVDNLCLGLSLGQTQCHQLGDLLTGDFSNGGLVDQLRVEIVCGDLRDCADLCVIHNNAVTFGMTGTAVVSVDL